MLNFNCWLESNPNWYFGHIILWLGPTQIAQPDQPDPNWSTWVGFFMFNWVGLGWVEKIKFKVGLYWVLGYELKPNTTQLNELKKLTFIIIKKKHKLIR